MGSSCGRIPSIFTSSQSQFKDGTLPQFHLNSHRPKLILKVFRLDEFGKIDNIAYGVVNLPNETGSFDLECPTWRPMSGWREESYNYYLGGPPKLANADPVVRDLN